MYVSLRLCLEQGALCHCGVTATGSMLGWHVTAMAPAGLAPQPTAHGTGMGSPCNHEPHTALLSCHWCPRIWSWWPPSTSLDQEQHRDWHWHQDTAALPAEVSQIQTWESAGAAQGDALIPTSPLCEKMHPVGVYSKSLLSIHALHRATTELRAAPTSTGVAAASADAGDGCDPGHSGDQGDGDTAALAQPSLPLGGGGRRSGPVQRLSAWQERSTAHTGVFGFVSY